MTSSKKRKFAQANGFDDTERKEITPTTAAADFNNKVIKKLQKALAKDPEVDLQTLFPSEYSSRLEAKKTWPGMLIVHIFTRHH